MPAGSFLVLAFAVAAPVAAVGGCDGDGDEETTTSATATTATAEETGTTGTGGLADDECSAHIDEASGESAGLEPDERCGASPPPVEITELNEAADAAGCRLELDLPDEGNQHIPRSRTPRYETNPPTSGSHDAIPLADGAYLEHPHERFYVHSLEHGRIVVHYDPDLPEEEQLALKGLFDEDPEGMVLIPTPEIPYEVAATAWRNGLGCNAYGPEALDAIRAFRDEFGGKGPERIPL